MKFHPDITVQTSSRRPLWGASPILVSSLAITCAFLMPRCSSDGDRLGVLPPANRAAPLAPGTKAELESQGAVCTPNESGPVLCTWANDRAHCSITFDAVDALTRLVCDVDGFRYECTRPNASYVCRWSDDADCADVYSAGGVFQSYACGRAIDDLIRPDCVDGGDAGTACIDDDATVDTSTKTDGGPHEDAGPPHDGDFPEDAGGEVSCGNTDGGCPTETSTVSGDCSSVNAEIEHPADLQRIVGRRRLGNLSIHMSAGSLELPNLEVVVGSISLAGSSTPAAEDPVHALSVGFPRLTEVDGEVRVIQAEGLWRLDLAALQLIGSHLTVLQNPDLAFINLASLKVVGYEGEADATFQQNNALVVVSLDSLEEVSGQAMFHENPRLHQAECPRLKHAGALTFHRNMGLQRAEFPRLDVVDGHVYFHANERLERVDLSRLSIVGYAKPSDGYFYFSGNSVLSTLSSGALEEVAQYLYVVDHPQLSLFTPDSLRFIGDYVYIAGNDVLCVGAAIPWEYMVAGTVTITESTACPPR